MAIGWLITSAAKTGSDQWGLARPQDAGERSNQPRGLLRLPPEQARTAHRGIVWIHLSAVIAWLFVALLLGTLLLAGKAVPPAIVIAGFGAAAGHGLFVLAHLYLASAAHRRAQRQMAADEAPDDPGASLPASSRDQK